MQFGASGFDEKLWERFKKEFISTPHAYAIGLGDYTDIFRPKLQVKIESAFAGDMSAREQMDGLVEREIRQLASKMDFLQGKILGMTSGHHQYEFLNGTNSTQKLCERLRAPYLGFAAYILLKLLYKKDNSALNVKIWLTHGSGGSVFSSTDLRNLEAKIAPYWNADIYLRGHSAKLEMAPITLYDITPQAEHKIVQRTKWIINCGGFMEGYVEGKETYVEQKNMPPAARGWAVMALTIRQKGRMEKKKELRWFNLEVEPRLVSPSPSN